MVPKPLIIWEVLVTELTGPVAAVPALPSPALPGLAYCGKLPLAVKTVGRKINFCTVRLAGVALTAGAVPNVPETGTLKVPCVVGVTVRVDDPGQFTGLGLKLVPERVELNCTDPLKPVVVEHVTVNVACWPREIVCDAGVITSVKVANVMFPLPLRVTPLLVPLTGMVYVPAATLVAIFSVNVEFPEPVTVGGLNPAQVIPAGSGVPQARVTTPLNPLVPATETVRLPVLAPKSAVPLATLTLKSWSVTLAVTVALSTLTSELDVELPLVVSVAVAVPVD